MIDPKKAIICWNHGESCEVMERLNNGGRCRLYRSSLGADSTKWKQMSNERILQVLVYMAVDISRQYEIDIEQIFQEILKVEGMNEYLAGLERDGCMKWSMGND